MSRAESGGNISPCNTRTAADAAVHNARAEVRLADRGREVARPDWMVRRNCTALANSTCGRVRRRDSYMGLNVTGNRFATHIRPGPGLRR
jgi:hypothetical protein